MSGLVIDEEEQAAASAFVNHLMRSEKDRKYVGELDDATQELRNYMKTQGVIDIQRFKIEKQQRMMQAKVSKDSIGSSQPGKAKSPEAKGIMEQPASQEATPTNRKKNETGDGSYREDFDPYGSEKKESPLQSPKKGGKKKPLPLDKIAFGGISRERREELLVSYHRE